MGSIKIDRGSLNSRGDSGSRSTRSSRSSDRSDRRAASRTTRTKSRKSSSRNRRKEREEVEEDSRGRRKKAKKKDNTMLIVGCVLGGVLVIVFICIGVAAANKPSPRAPYVSSKPQIPHASQNQGRRIDEAQLTEAQRKIMAMDLSKEMNADNELLKQRQRERAKYQQGR